MKLETRNKIANAIRYTIGVIAGAGGLFLTRIAFIILSLGSRTIAEHSTLATLISIGVAIGFGWLAFKKADPFGDRLALEPVEAPRPKQPSRTFALIRSLNLSGRAVALARRFVSRAAFLAEFAVRGAKLLAALWERMSLERLLGSAVRRPSLRARFARRARDKRIMRRRRQKELASDTRRVQRRQAA